MPRRKKVAKKVEEEETEVEEVKGEEVKAEVEEVKTEEVSVKKTKKPKKVYTLLVPSINFEGESTFDADKLSEAFSKSDKGEGKGCYAGSSGLQAAKKFYTKIRHACAQKNGNPPCRFKIRDVKSDKVYEYSGESVKLETPKVVKRGEGSWTIEYDSVVRAVKKTK